MENIIFQIDGGLGKNILATAVCTAIKRKYPNHRLIVLSAYPDVFINNDDVDRAFNTNNLTYFYKDYIEDKNSKIFFHNPYLETEYIYEREHLIETWCKLFDLPYSNDLMPKLSLTEREKSFYQKKYTTDKPILVIQPNGGFNADLKYAWSRDLPSNVVLSIIEEFKNDYNIVHIKRDDQLSYDFTFPVTNPFRDVLSLLLLSQKRLLIDSFVQHATASLNLPSVVCWVGTSPKVFGYNLHENIVSNKETKKAELRDAFITRNNIGGNPLEFPFNNENEIFNVDKIIESLKK